MAIIETPDLFNCRASRIDDGNGSERDGPLMLVDFSPTDPKHGGGMSITGTDGIRKGLFNMIDVQYASRSSAFLGR